MKILEINAGTGRSRILIGERLANVKQYVPAEKVVIVTDTRVWDLYGETFPFPDIIRIGTGEGIKTLETVQDIYRQLVALEADRSWFLLGIGGGIVCDVAGFVASTYMRGIGFGFVSSTLLSQVDASVGGKNGVNFGGYKNMVGVFNQPEFVICDTDLLKTLPRREVLCGLAEVVKHALIGDPALFRFLEENAGRALDIVPEVMERLVYDSVVLKAAFVNRDERERGERRKLNFGHTFGHAIEKTTGLPHGEAVSAGMITAAALSVSRGLLTAVDASRIEKLFKRLGLPTRIQAEGRVLLDALRKDKKKEGNRIHFILLEGIGRAVVKEVSIEELAGVVGS